MNLSSFRNAQSDATVPIIIFCLFTFGENILEYDETFELCVSYQNLIISLYGCVCQCQCQLLVALSRALLGALPATGA